MSGFTASALLSLGCLRIIMPNLPSKRKLVPLAGLLVADLLLLGSTDATKVTSLVVIIVFCLIVMTTYLLIYGLVVLAKLYGLPVRRPKLFARYLTFIVGLLLALQSTGELGSKDVLVLVPLAILAYVYNSYAKTSKRAPG